MANQSPGETPIVAFFRGTGFDCECRTLDEILSWDDTLLELCHDYIQWLFPTDEKSSYNWEAPTLDSESQRVFRGDQQIQRNMRRGLVRFLSFLGLSLEDCMEPPRVVKAASFDKRRLMCWQGPANHNWKRISRVLRCLELVGMQKEQRALHECLIQIVAENPGMIEEKTIKIWRTYAGTPSTKESMQRGRLVRFEVQCSASQPGEQLVLVGSAEELGAWVPARSRAVLTTSGPDFPAWRSGWLVLGEQPTMCEYKYVILSREGGGRWEPGPNRQLNLPSAVPAGVGIVVTEAFGEVGASHRFEEPHAAHPSSRPPMPGQSQEKRATTTGLGFGRVEGFSSWDSMSTTASSMMGSPGPDLETCQA
mmetsp:Transcript_118493/g.330583  ORF Transcript_118493/g.330583 Transcript_118493/m.330583 type:complete len:365 (+) Transcript_118493:104-1198(+)